MRTANRMRSASRRTRSTLDVRLGLEQLESRLLLDASLPASGPGLDLSLEPAGGPTESQSHIVEYRSAAGGDDLSGGDDPTGGASYVIPGVPNYLWQHGCGPTSAGMVVGYWDMHGFPNLAAGDSSTQTTGANDAIANSEHYDDYSLPLDDETPTILPDKSSTGGAHASNCIGDWMHTSRSADGLRYGWSSYSMIGTAIDSYCEAKGYASFTTTNKTFSNFSFAEFKAEIDANRPMVFLVDSDGDGGTDHFVPAIGYNDSTNQYACYDTWYSSTRWCDFIEMTAGRPWGIYGAVLVQPPQMTVTNPQVTPLSGTVADTFTFSAQYQGPTPTSSTVTISNGVGEKGLTLASGSAYDGVYRLATTLAGGSYTYSFTFKFGTTTATTITKSGPTVTATGTDLAIDLQAWTDAAYHAAMDNRHSDWDGVAEGREAVLATIRLHNIGAASVTNVSAHLNTAVSSVTMTNANVSYGAIAQNGYANGNGAYAMYLGFDSWTDLPFTLAVSYVRNSATFIQNFTLSQTFHADGTNDADVVVDRVVVSDATGGDGDGVPESGEELALDVYLKNAGEAAAVHVRGQISDLKGTDFIADLTDGWHAYPDIAVGGSQKQSVAYDTGRIPTWFAGQLTADITVLVGGDSQKVFEDYPICIVQPAAWIEVEPSVWDFDVCPNRDDVMKDVIVTNVGSADMTVSGIVVSHADTTCQVEMPTLEEPWVLAPGQSATVPVVIDAANLQGAIARQVRFLSDARLATTSPPSDRIAITGTIDDLPPEITVLDDLTIIVCGQTDPIELGSAMHRATGPSRIFTIRNDGMKPLVLTTPLARTPHFILGQPGKTTLAEGETTTFTVTLDTSSLWSGSETISLVNNDQGRRDSIENPFTFVVSGTVESLPPEITLLDGNAEVVSGAAAAIDLGPAVLGEAGPSKTFTIRNDGDDPLVLATPFTGTAHIAVGQPALATLAAGESTTFSVTLLTTEVWQGSERLTLESNDSDYADELENPFDFAVGGTVYPSRVIVGDATAYEGKSGGAKLQFVATLVIPSTEWVTVGYAIVGGTATPVKDFTAAAGSLRFAPGQTRNTVSVAVMGDNRYESDETVELVLTNARSELITRCTGTIVNDDKTPKVSVKDVKIKEGNSGTTTATFTATLSAISGRDTIVHYSTEDGTAKAGEDYVSTGSTTVTIPAGQRSRTFTVAIQGDTVYETNETFAVNLTQAEGAELTRNKVVATILKEDRAPAASIADAVIVQGPAGMTAEFVVTLSSPSGLQAAVRYATVNGTAKADKDYTALAGALIFEPGETQKTVSVAILDNPSRAWDAKFQLKLSNPKEASLATKSKGTCILPNPGASSLMDALATSRKAASQSQARRIGPAVDQAIRLLMLTSQDE